MASAIGFFDSGIGGLSVMKRAIELLPNEDYLYYGDNQNAPYGEKTRAEILDLTRRGVFVLLEKGVKALVIACNTATSAAAASLRAELRIPVVAMEPALKPASEKRRGGQVIVLATRATLQQEKFADLYAKYGEGAVCVPGTGIVELIEKGVLAGPELEARLHAVLDGALSSKTDVIVLGCTHYNFIRRAVANVAGPQVEIIDSIDGTVRQLERVLIQNGLRETALRNGTCEILTSGREPRLLPYMQALLSGSQNIG